MAVVVEDGTGVANANSYVTLAEARTFATARDVTLTTDDVKLEVLLVKAKDYLEGIRDRYKGTKIYGQGYLQWPRLNVVIDGFPIDSDSIPTELKDAQCQLVIELLTVDPMATDSGGLRVKREKLDILETEYFSPREADESKSFPKVDAYLDPICRDGYSPLLTLRI